MPTSVCVVIQGLRTEQRRLRRAGMLPRLWRAACREVERLLDRSVTGAALRQGARRG